MSRAEIHPTAIVHPNARIGAGSRIGPYCVIGEHVVFGENCAKCHSGWALTDFGFHDIGIAGEDKGRGARLPHQIAATLADTQRKLRA